MNLLRIGKTVINLDNVTCIDLEVSDPDMPTFPDPKAPQGVLISFNVVSGSFGYIDGNCGHWHADRIWFTGDEAALLRQWIEDFSMNAAAAQAVLDKARKLREE